MCLGIIEGPQLGVSPSASTEISLMGGILDDIKVPCVVLHGSSVHLCSLHLTFYTKKKVSILILKFIIFIHKHFSLCIAP